MNLPKATNRLFLKCCYGGFFVILLPALLAFWAVRLDRLGAVAWPVPVAVPVGVACLAVGLMLIGIGMRALWVFGNGLPMNAFPPERLVERSVYRLVPHPIYFGFCLAVFGLAALFRSPSGFWIVGPVSICAVLALVWGYEGPELQRRLGPMENTPLFGLPCASEASLSWPQALALILVAWGPWAVLYALFSLVPGPARAEELRFPFELGWPHSTGWLWIYSLAYPFVGLAPLTFTKARQARSAIEGIWAASALGFAWMLLLPGKAEFLPSGIESLDWLIAANRSLDADWLACPSFHTAWAFTAAGLYSRRFPAWRFVFFLFAALVAASCVGVGAHALVDIAGGALLAALALCFDQISHKIMFLTERLANSWHAYRVGFFRVISHVSWTALSAFVGTFMALVLAGPDFALQFIGIMIAGVFGALVFGRLVEGRHLSRPFGYFGFLLGCLAALAFVLAIDPNAAATLAAATACAAPVAQAIGRGRCLVQGCCHGRPGEGSWTIRVRNPQSRIVCVAALADEPVYATQLLSAVFNLGIAAILLVAWRAQASALLICGLYLLMTSFARFAEEGWRGEPQTPGKFGLSLYQWICAVLAPVGIVLTMIQAPAVPETAGISMMAALAALAVAVLMSFMMSIDWPDSRLPLSRLAPPS